MKRLFLILLAMLFIVVATVGCAGLAGHKAKLGKVVQTVSGVKALQADLHKARDKITNLGTLPADETTWTDAQRDEYHELCVILERVLRKRVTMNIRDGPVATPTPNKEPSA